MKDLIVDQFQNSVDEVLIRHDNVLDVITKMSDATAKVNRAVAKTITSCGCVEMHSAKQDIPDDANYEALKAFSKSNMSGELCTTCREKIEAEIGNQLFYLAALCNHMDINLYDVFLKEFDRIKTLGKYNLY